MSLCEILPLIKGKNNNNNKKNPCLKIFSRARKCIHIASRCSSPIYLTFEISPFMACHTSKLRLKQGKFQCHVSTCHLGTLTQIYHRQPPQKLCLYLKSFSIFVHPTTSFLISGFFLLPSLLHLHSSILFCAF